MSRDQIGVCYDIQWSETADREWLSVPAINAGRMKRKESAPNGYALILKNDIPCMCVKLFADDDDVLVFKASAILENSIALGWGSRVSFIHLDSKISQEIYLGSYFGSLVALPNNGGLLVASGERLFLFRPDAKLVWKSNVLGIDGVIIDGVQDDIIFGQGEWDPPGGWKPFQVRLNSGHTVFAGKLD